VNHLYLIILCFFLLGQFSLPAQEYELKYDWHISVSSDGNDVGLRQLFPKGDRFVAFLSGSSGETLKISTPFNTIIKNGADTITYALMFNTDGSFEMAIPLAITSVDSEFLIHRIEEKSTGGFVILGSVEGTVDFLSDENSFQLMSSSDRDDCFLEMTENFEITKGFLLNSSDRTSIRDFTLLDNGDIGLVGSMKDTTDLAPLKDEYIEAVPQESGDYGLRASYFLLLDSNYSVKNHQVFEASPDLFLTHLAFTKDRNFLVLSDFIFEAFLPTGYSETELVRVTPRTRASALIKADSSGNFFDHALFPHYNVYSSFNYDAQRASIPLFVVIHKGFGDAEYRYLEFQDNLEIKKAKTLLSYDRNNRVNIYVSKFTGIDQIYLSGNTMGRVDFDPNPDNQLMNRESCAYNFLYKVETSGDMEIEYLHEDSMGYQGGFIPLDIIEMNNQVITCGSANNEMLINACKDNEIYLNYEDASGVIISYKKSKPTSTNEAEASRGYWLINNPENRYFVLKNSSNETLNYKLFDVYGRTLIQGTCSDPSCKIEWPDYSGVLFIRIADSFGHTLGTDVLQSP
jgi:hypothetical protein